MKISFGVEGKDFELYQSGLPDTYDYDRIAEEGGKEFTEDLVAILKLIFIPPY